MAAWIPYVLGERFYDAPEALPRPSVPDLTDGTGRRLSREEEVSNREKQASRLRTNHCAVERRRRKIAQFTFPEQMSKNAFFNYRFGIKI